MQVGGTLAGGDGVEVVEAMKMEIPVASPASGTLKALLLEIDDLVTEGHAIGVVAR